MIDFTHGIPITAPTGTLTTTLPPIFEEGPGSSSYGSSYGGFFIIRQSVTNAQLQANVHVELDQFALHLQMSDT